MHNTVGGSSHDAIMHATHMHVPTVVVLLDLCFRTCRQCNGSERRAVVAAACIGWLRCNVRRRYRCRRCRWLSQGE